MRGSLMRASFFAAVLFASCSPNHGGDDDDDSVGDDAGARDAAADAARDAEPEPRDAEPELDSAVVEDEVIVWAHSSSTLYAFDPRENVVSTVGDFVAPGGGAVEDMTDLAVNKDGRVLSCSNLSLYDVDTETAEATLIATFPLEDGVRFYGLTFLPEDVIDENRETLVGATSNGEYFRVDEDTGDAELLGQFSDGYVLSGDIVSVEGAGTFATVKRDDIDSDVLVELDPMTGEVTRVGTEIGYESLFGLGYWRSRLFGFSSRGELVDIDIDSGAGSLVAGDTGTDQFWGAGVTTIAPVGPF